MIIDITKQPKNCVLDLIMKEYLKNLVKHLINKEIFKKP